MQLDQAFAPLKEELSKRIYTIADIFEMVGCWVEEVPHISRAMALHARDILAESSDIDSTTVLIEMYRRTFFDMGCAKLYGTAHLCERGPATLAGFATFLVSSLQMDSAASAVEGSNVLQ